MGLSHLSIARTLGNAEVVSICDSFAPLVKALKKNLGVAGFTDYREMLEKCSLDGVIISVPNAMHFEVANDCLASGVNVFIEKPMTANYSHSRELIRQSESTGSFGQVGYMNRYNLIFQHLHDLLAANVVGEIVSYESRALGAVVTKADAKGWRNDYKKGGGCLFDYGAHAIDLALFLFGEDAEVWSSRLKRIFSTSVDDAVFATLVHKDGKIGTVRVNWSDKSIRKMVNQIEVFGTEGKILANKQEIKIYLGQARKDLSLSAGWNSIYVTDMNTDVGHYLRGEEYSLQLEAFAASLHDPKLAVISSLTTASQTDRLLEEIFKKSGELA